MRRAAVPTALVSALVLVSTLALGSVASAGSDQPLTKKQFIKQSDKICLATQRQADQLAGQYFGALPAGQDPDLATLTAFWEAYAPVVEGEIDDLRALKEPNADRKKVKQLLKAVQSGVDTVTDDPAVLFTGTPFANADRLARAYGFKVCGTSDSNN
jgi:hypothetical protein